MVDSWRVVGAVTQISMRHPVVASLVMQTYQSWNAHADETAKIVEQWQAAAPQATGMLDYAALVGQLVKDHPAITTLLAKTLGEWNGRIPEAIQCLTEFEAAMSAS